MRGMKRTAPRWIAGLVAVAALGVVALMADPLWLRISTVFESSLGPSDRAGYLTGTNVVIDGGKLQTLV